MKKIFLLFSVMIICQYSFAQDWFPLEVGNKWHLIEFGAVAMSEYSIYYGYTHRYPSVFDSTNIDGIKYYYFTKFFGFNTATPIRYDKLENKIYVYKNGVDNLFMDFNLPDSALFLQVLPNGSFTESRISVANKIILNDTIVVKGFFRKTYNLTNMVYYKWGYYYFAENIGFVFQDEYPPEWWSDNNWYDYSLGEYLVKVDGLQYHKKHNYVADIRFNPITYLPNSTFITQQFKIYHPLSFYQYWWNDTYLDSTYIDFFYSNEIDTLQKGKSQIPATSEVDFNLNFQIDTVKYNQGYHLFYRIMAKDRGIISSYYYKPDSGYYKLYWRDSTASSIEVEINAPLKYSLEQNYPNPFNPATTIKFSIPAVGTRLALSVQLKVFDVLGKEVATLVNEEKPAGNYEVLFNSHSDEGQNLPSGVYFYQLKAEDFIQTKKMILLK